MKISVLPILFFTLTACTWTIDCPEKINVLPMFGNALKCPEQIRADSVFLSTVDKQYNGDRKRAAKDWTERAAIKKEKLTGVGFQKISVV